MAQLLTSCDISQEPISLTKRETKLSLSENFPQNPPIGICENDLEDCWDKAFNQGYEEGKLQGAIEAQEKISIQFHNQVDSLEKLFQNIRLELSASRESLKEEIADITLMIIGRLFIHQQQNKAIIIEQIESILQMIHAQQTIKIFLHPQDITLIQEKVKINLGYYNDFRIIPDEQLILGGCRIHTSHGIFNGSIEQQIDNLKQILLQIKQEVKS